VQRIHDIDEATPARVTATDVTTASVAVTMEDTTQIVYAGWPTSFGQFNSKASRCHVWRGQPDCGRRGPEIRSCATSICS
jgi:hypothetical protein